MFGLAWVVAYHRYCGPSGLECRDPAAAVYIRLDMFIQYERTRSAP